MADSSSTVPQVVAGSGAAVQVNSLFDAGSPALLGGRNSVTTTGLTWGYLGGRIGGVSVPNGTVALTPSATNYIVIKNSDGVVSASTSLTNWNDTSAYTKLYLVVAGGSSVTSHQDWRDLLGGGGGGGLTNFTEGLTSAAPNATIPVASLAATNAATNVDFAILTKGNGAILAALPNNLASGGNKRGTQAVDFQMNRGNVIHVASGNWSVIGGGLNNAATAQAATVSGGNGNQATGLNSTAGGGQSNAASSAGCTIAGGITNTASSTQATVGGGNTNTASGNYSTVPGGRGNVAAGSYSMAIGYLGSARGRAGGFAQACASFATAGQAQRITLVYFGITTNATPLVLNAQNTVVGLENYYLLENNMSVNFRVRVIACQHTTGDTAAFLITGCIKRRANAASTVIVGTPTSTVIAADAGAAAWAISATADTANGGLQVTVTGEAAKTIRWVCEFECVEMVSG